MDFSSGRLEAPSRVTEYSPKYSEEERNRRARRGKATPPPDEETLTLPEDDEIHQFDDVV